MFFWWFILFFSLSLKTGCSIRLVLVLFRLFLCRWVLSCFDILFLEMSILQIGHSTFSFCIVHNVPSPFVSILLYGILYIVVCIRNIFDSAFPASKFSNGFTVLHVDHFLPLSSLIEVLWGYIFK